MAKRKISKAKPGRSVTRKVTRGANKGDTVKFTANSSRAARPGKLNPRKLVKDVGARNTSSLPRKKKRR